MGPSLPLFGVMLTGSTQSPRRRLWLLAAVLAAAAVVVAIAVAVSSGGDPESTPADTAPSQAAEVADTFAGIPQRGERLGSPDAPVTMVEFADLKCPACREYAAEVLPVLVRDYVRTGKLQIRFSPQTFVGSPPGDSERGARVALAAGAQGKLWQFADRWYRNQQDENTAYASDDFIRSIASQVRGLDIERALAERDSLRVTRALQRAARMFERSRLGGTPSFLLGPTGRKLEPFTGSDLAAAIDDLAR